MRRVELVLRAKALEQTVVHVPLHGLSVGRPRSGLSAGRGNRCGCRRVVGYVYRYRLLEEATGADLGPLISARLAFASGEVIGRRAGEEFEIVNVVEAENENFRAYLVVRRP